MMSKNSSINDLLSNISLSSNIPIEKLLLVETSLNYSITILENSTSSTLNDLGINTKAELIVFEVRKTIEDCEEMGRKALDYKSRIEIGEQIDIFSGDS